MKLTLTNSQLFALLERKPDRSPVGPLPVLASQSLNVAAAQKLQAIIRICSGPWRDMMTVRDQLISTHGEKGGITNASPGWSAFVSEYAELMKGTVEVDVEPLTLAELWHWVKGEREPVNLSSDGLDRLGSLLADNQTQNEKDGKNG